MLSGDDETERQLESKQKKLKQTNKFAECIGKNCGFTCKNCPYRSYCDGIPEDLWAYKKRIKTENQPS